MDARPLSPARRFAHGLALVALIVLGGFLDALHRAGSRHAVCPEHGEVVHVADVHAPCAAARPDVSVAGHAHVAHAHLAPAPDADASQRSEPAGPTLESTGAPAAHDHCLFATLLRDSGAAWCETGARAAPVASLARVRPVWPAAVAPARAPLSYAPKQSPPSRSGDPRIS